MTDTAVLYYTSNDGVGPLSDYWTLTPDNPGDTEGCGCCSLCYGQIPCVAWSYQNGQCYLVYADALIQDLTAECYAAGVTVYDDPSYPLQEAIWGWGPCGAQAGTLPK